MRVAVEAVAVHETLHVVLFSAGGWRIGIEARWMRSARPAPKEATGEQIESLLGLVPTVSNSSQYLIFKRPDGDREILVGSAVDLVSLPVDTIHPLPPLLAARTALHGLRALVKLPDNTNTPLILLFDAPNWPDCSAGCWSDNGGRSATAIDLPL